MSSPNISNDLLPHDKLAEQAILGAVLLKNDVLFQIAETVIPTDFFSPAHQRIFQAMLELQERNAPIDEVTLGNWLRDHNHLEQSGGAAYLVELANSTPVVDNVQHYALIVREKGRLRELIQAASEIAKQGREAPDFNKLLTQASATISAIETKSVSRSYQLLKDTLLTSFDILEKRSKASEIVTGVPTGFMELDHTTHGFQPADLVILAARPSMGKTALALNMALYPAIHHQTTVLVFSLEMPKEQLAMRLLCSESKLDSHKLQVGNLEQDDWDKLAVAASRMMESKVFIDDEPAITPLHIRRIAKQIHGQHGLGLIVVDYLQLMRAPLRTNSREQEIAEISRSLKAIAKEFNIPVIALSQLNRDLERRADKRPVMADLRESGAIEQDADLIMFIYRDEVYNPETPDAGIAEIIIAKHRNGEIGTKRLAFIGKYTKFANLTLNESSY